MNTCNVRQFANLIGVSVNTLQRWDREGRLKPQRTPGNRRLYTDEHPAFVHRASRLTVRITAVYAPVSSQAQKPDLDNHIRVLEQFCKEHEVERGKLLKKLRTGDKAPVVRETFMSCRIRMQKGMWLAFNQANQPAQ